MDAGGLFAQYGLYAGTAIYGFLGGVVPVFNLEAYMLVLASTTDVGRRWILLAAILAVAHISAKLLVYAGASGVSARVPERHQARVEQVRRRLEGWRFGRAGFVFTSALVGFPPFYAVTLVAGMLRFGWVRFACAALPGSFLRAAMVLLFPDACMRLFKAL